MQEIVETFIENNDVTFEMVAKVNGEVVVRFESDQSFDDLTGYSTLADDAFDTYVTKEEEARIDYQHSVEADRADGSY